MEMTSHKNLIYLTRRGRLVLIFFVALSAFSVFYVSAGASAMDAKGEATAPATSSQVHRAVQAGASVTRVPRNLHPDLLHAAKDNEQIFNSDCALARQKDDATFGECVYGPAKAKGTFILLGDSHAGMWFDGLKKAAALGGWRMRIFYKTGCPAPSLTFYRNGAECNSWRARAIAAIRKLKPAIVVVTSATFEEPISKDSFASATEWEAGLEKTLTSLKQPGTRLVILGDIPILAQSAPECLAAHMSNVQECSTARTDAVKDVLTGAEAAAARATGAQRIDVTSWLCATICPPIVNNILVYRNQFHITHTYSIYLAGVLRTALHL
jgi:hypothetical protein